MKETWIEVAAADGGSFAAYLATPAAGSGPGLVLCQDVFGVDDAMRRMADLFAEEGYVVLVPDLSWRLQPRIDLEPADPRPRHRFPSRSRCGDGGHRQHDRGPSSPAGVQGQDRRPRPWPRRSPRAHGRSDRRGRLRGELRRHRHRPGRRRPARDAGTLLLHLAGTGPMAAPSAVDAIRRRLAPDAEVYVYPGVAPGFAIPGRAAYDKQGADMAHTRTIALLRRVLGPRYDLSALWEAHRACEFISRDVDATMRTMVAEPYVNHVPTLTGGYGQANLRRFYKDHFIPKSPKDTRTDSDLAHRRCRPGRQRSAASASPTIARSTGCCRACRRPASTSRSRWSASSRFAATSWCTSTSTGTRRRCWCRSACSIPTGLPVTGVESAKKVLDPSLPANVMMKRWAQSANDD